MFATAIRKLIPPNSQLRSKLGYAVRRLNLGVTAEFRKNFVQLEDKDRIELKQALEDHYLPEKYQLDTLNSHLYLRTNIDRYSIVPWIKVRIQGV